MPSPVKVITATFFDFEKQNTEISVNTTLKFLIRLDRKRMQKTCVLPKMMGQLSPLLFYT